jgi:aminomethyltransferase
MEAGARYGIQPGAPSQIKRIEAGLLSYWNDMDIHTNPFEVGLGNFIDTDQDVDFVGKSALQDILKKGISQRLMGAVVDGDPILVNEECWPVRCGEQVIGKVTSAVYSPLLDQNLVYVMLPIGHAKPDAIIDIVMPCGDIRSATITQLPFTSNRAR